MAVLCMHNKKYGIVKEGRIPKDWKSSVELPSHLHLATDNYTSTLQLSFYRPDALPASQPTASKH